jgi:hypothetical protein
MTRLVWSFLSAAVILAIAPPPVAARHEPSNRRADLFPDKSDLGWVLVSDGITSVSDGSDLESLKVLQARYGARFLLLRDGDDRYLIRDKELIDRAEHATRSIKLYGKEIGLLARHRAGDAIASRKGSRKIAAMAQRGPRDESEAQLEREVEQLIRDMETLGADSRPIDSARSRELEGRREVVSKQLHEAVRQGQDEMRRILKDAQARNVAKRVE